MRILLATGRYPWPPRRGDQLRSSQYLELLGETHDLQLLVPTPHRGAAPPPQRWAERVAVYPVSAGWRLLGLLRALLAGNPLQNGLFWQPSLARELRRRSAEVDVVVLVLARLASHRTDVVATPVLVDFVDSLALNFSRRTLYDRRWKRPVLRMEAARLARCESRLLHATAGGAVVCERDRQALAERVPDDVARRLRVVPIAVTPRGEPSAPRPEGEPPILAFTGNLGYFVNDDALRWWLEEVWPPLSRRIPHLRLAVAGQRPSFALRRQVERAGGELVDSPLSLRPILERATLSIAPLRCGSGVPVKILEAWEAGVPVIASRWAAAGTLGREGEELLVADSVEEWVDAVERLLGDPRLRARLAASGRSCLERRYAPSAVASTLEAWLRAAGATSSSPPES